MERVWPEAAEYRPQSATPPASEPAPRGPRIADLASRQHGIVTLGQLGDLGLAPRSVRGRVATGHLHRLHRGVYAVGHRVVPREGHWLAAVLACGEGAVLSHRSSAALWGIRSTTQSRIDVTSASRAGRSRPGIAVHSGATLLPEDVTEIDRIPCTSLPRTLLDLAEVVHRQALERAIHEAEILRVFDGRALAELLRRTRGRPGAARLEAAIAEGDFTGPGTRSELENGFFRFCARHGLPRPEANIAVDLPDGSCEVDFVWRAQRFVIETDGKQFHDLSRAFERDRTKDQRLDLSGWRCLRCTWRQVTRDDPVLVEVVRRRLAAKASP